MVGFFLTVPEDEVPVIPWWPVLSYAVQKSNHWMREEIQCDPVRMTHQFILGVPPWSSRNCHALDAVISMKIAFSMRRELLLKEGSLQGVCLRRIAGKL